MLYYIIHDCFLRRTLALYEVQHSLLWQKATIILSLIYIVIMLQWHVCVCVCVCVCMYVCVHVYVCMYMFVCVYVCVFYDTVKLNYLLAYKGCIFWGRRPQMGGARDPT